MFTAFRQEMPTTAGFYVFRYREGHEDQVYVDQIKEGHHPKIKGYCSVYVNDKNNVPHDCGSCVWVNHPTVHGPVSWRMMTMAESAELKSKLFQFRRTPARVA